MTSPSAGIQQLLAAEKKAADKVGEARKSEFIVTPVEKEMSCDVKIIINF